MPSLPKSVLADHIINALGDELVSHGDTGEVPLGLSVIGLAMPLAVYAYTVSDPPGGRPADELKIQLIAPGQQKGDLGNFIPPDEESFAVLLGYSVVYDAFVLWDAYKHRNFAWSKNCQIRLAAIKDAQISGLGYRDRRLQTGDEHIIVARPDHLSEAFRERIHSL